jgi:hypothetical protein
MRSKPIPQSCDRQAPGDSYGVWDAKLTTASTSLHSLYDLVCKSDASGQNLRVREKGKEKRIVAQLLRGVSDAGCANFARCCNGLSTELFPSER